MKKQLFIFLLMMGTLATFGQGPLVRSSNKPTPEMEQYWKEWTRNLYERGVEMAKDSIRMNKEAIRIVNDSNYRKVIYPKQYTWTVTKELMKKMHMKVAFWYLLNLYSKDTANKTAVLTALLPYDGLYEMDRALTASFYTYAMLDPSVCTIKKGKPQITNPVLLEKRFATLKEVVGYVQSYRKQAKK